MSDPFREIPDLIYELIKDHCICTVTPIDHPFIDDLETTISIIAEGEIEKEIEIFYRRGEWEGIEIRVYNWEADDMDQFTDPWPMYIDPLPYRTKKGIGQKPLGIKFNLHTAEGLDQLANYLITNCKGHTVTLTYQETK